MDLKIPFISRDQRLDDPSVLDLPRALADPAERAVADRLLIDAMGDPSLTTVGDLLDLLERASPEEHRRIADQACEAAGVTTFTSRYVEAAVERGRRAAPLARDPEGRAHQVCAAPDCTVVPVSEVTGTEVPVRALRWWCPEHAPGHEADLEPWRQTYRYSEADGTLLDADDLADDERERERREREQERQRQRREQAAAERHEQAAERAALVGARRLQDEAEFPDPLIPRP